MKTWQQWIVFAGVLLATWFGGRWASNTSLEYQRRGYELKRAERELQRAEGEIVRLRADGEQLRDLRIRARFVFDGAKARIFRGDYEGVGAEVFFRDIIAELEPGLSQPEEIR